MELIHSPGALGFMAIEDMLGREITRAGTEGGMPAAVIAPATASTPGPSFWWVNANRFAYPGCAAARAGRCGRGLGRAHGGASQLPVACWHQHLGLGRFADTILDYLNPNPPRSELNMRDAILHHFGQSDK